MALHHIELYVNAPEETEDEVFFNDYLFYYPELLTADRVKDLFAGVLASDIRVSRVVITRES